MKNHRSFRTYILIALGWTYTFWILAAVISSMNPAWFGIMVLHILGGIGPLVATVFVVSQTKNWREYLSRLFKFSSLFPSGWLIIFTPIIFAFAAGMIANGTITLSADFINQGLFYAIFLFFFGPLPEELGWRGVLFDGLFTRSILIAQAVTAAVWLSWHIPLFFIVGSYQWGIGFGTLGFLFWAVGLILQSIIMGYLYILSKRGIPSAVLFHYMVNLVGEALDMDITTQILILVFYAVLALGLGIFFSKKTLKTEN